MPAPTKTQTTRCENLCILARMKRQHAESLDHPVARRAAFMEAIEAFKAARLAVGRCYGHERRNVWTLGITAMEKEV